MLKTSIPKANNHLIYLNKQNNIINNNTNRIKYLLINSSSYITNNKNNLDINEDNYDFNSQIIQSNANIKEMNLKKDFAL